MHWQITLLCFWSVDLLTFNKYKRQINKSMEEFVDQQHCSETHCDTFGIAIYIIHWCETRCDIHYSVCMIRCIRWSETRCNIHCGVCMIHCIHWILWRVYIPLLPVSSLFTFPCLSDTQKIFIVICFSKVYFKRDILMAEMR